MSSTSSLNNANLNANLNDIQKAGVARLRTLLLEFSDTVSCLPALKREVEQWLTIRDVDYAELARGLEPQLVAATDWLMDFDLLPSAAKADPELVEFMERATASVKCRTVMGMVTRYEEIKQHTQNERAADEKAESARVIDSRYEVLANGSEIRDLDTNLVWQRCQVGQKWGGMGCTGKAKDFTYEEAEKLVNKDWRLPTKEELLTLVDLNVGRPTINHKAFPNTPNSNVWTCTPYAFYSGYMWLVDFNNGCPNGNSSYVNGVRLVRTESSEGNDNG